MLTLHTFGDSILDCGHYNPHRVHPGGLIVKNDDRLFPEFAGRDLAARGPARLDHRAADGATVEDLPRQLRGLKADGPGVALLTIGGNDLLADLFDAQEPDVEAFARALDDFLRGLPIRPVLIGNIYDPSCGDDALNFVGIPAARARAVHARMNAAIAAVAPRHGTLVDLHAHFLAHGDPSWFTRTIEPSLRGASEVRRCFLGPLLP